MTHMGAEEKAERRDCHLEIESVSEENVEIMDKMSDNNCPDSSRMSKQPVLSSPELETEDETGGHDTITSLAGLNVIEKYRSALRPGLSNSRISTEESNDSSHVTRLSDLFRSQESKELIEDIEEEEEINFTSDFQPPDGGYGWLVVLGAFVAIFWCAGVVKSYGVLFTALLHEFPDASASLASWIPASMTSVALLVSPFTSALCQRLNCRWVTFCGALLSALGLASSSLAVDLKTLFLTMGLITGSGMGMSSTPGILLTARYFDRHLAKANAICLSGSAAGSFSLPFIMHFLLEKVGFRATLLVLGLGMTSILGSAALYRPIEVHARLMSEKKSRERNETNFNEKMKNEKQMSVENDLESGRMTSLSEEPDIRDSQLSLASSAFTSASVLDPSRLLPSRHLGQTDRSGGKSLSLRELYMHQLGSRWSVAKSRLLQQHSFGENGHKVGLVPKKHRSLMFSLEDLTTDASCILKDKKSLIPDNQLHCSRQSVLGPGLNRSRSSASSTDKEKMRRRSRPRYVSEGHEENNESRFHLVPIQDVIEEEQNKEEERKESTILSKFSRLIDELFDLQLFQEPLFWLLVASVLCLSCGVPHVLFFLPAHAEKLGFGAASILSAGAIFDLVGRFLLSLILDMRIVPHFVMFSVVILVSGVSILLIPLANAYWQLVTLVALLSLGFGTSFLMIPLLLAEYFGVDRIASAYGTMRFLQAGANLLGPAVAGYLWESRGDLDLSFVFMGAVVALGALFNVWHPRAIRHKEKRDAKNEENKDKERKGDKGSKEKEQKNKAKKGKIDEKEKNDKNVNNDSKKKNDKNKNNDSRKKNDKNKKSEKKENNSKDNCK